MIRKYAEIFCWKNVSSFCSAKATHIFSAKNIRILCIDSAKTVNKMTELVKLTMLWTTGPRAQFLVHSVFCSTWTQSLPQYFSWMHVWLVIRRLQVWPLLCRQHSFMELDHEILSTVILSLPQIQEGQLSVSGERLCIILVNRLEDYACPVKVWLGKLTALNMTPMGWLNLTGP